MMESKEQSGKHQKKQTEIAFVQGDSERLGEILLNDSADVLMNIESSHCYGNIEAYFQGVCQVLKDDGLFIYADFR